MKKLVTLLAAGVAMAAVSSAWAQEPPKHNAQQAPQHKAEQKTSEPKAAQKATGGKSPSSSPHTGYEVAINNPQSNDDANKNPSMGPITVIASCNATAAPKDLEGWVGDNSPVTVQNMVASLSGTARQSITIVVPWGWHYKFNVSEQPMNGPIPVGGSCHATAWWSTT